MTQPTPPTNLTATAGPGLFARHPLNIGHLVMGLVFLGMVGVWALVQTDAVSGDDIRWLLPVPWVLAGTAGLLATTLSGRGPNRSNRPAQVTSWGDQPTDQPTDQPADQEENR